MDERAAWVEYVETRDFAQLMRHYAPFLKAQKARMIFRYAYRMAGIATPDDVASEVERGFYSATVRFDPTRGNLTSLARLTIGSAVKDFFKSYDVSETLYAKGVRKPGSIHVKDDGDGGKTTIDIEDHGADTLDLSLASVDLWHRIYHVLRIGNTRGLLVLNLLYREQWAGTEVAHYFDVTESSVSQWKANALAVLGRSPSMRRWARGDYRKRKLWRSSTPKRPPSKGFHIPHRAHCCVVDCNDPTYKRGKCHRHYFESRVDVPECRIAGCDKPSRTGGLCVNHYLRHNRRTRAKPFVSCSVEGCQKVRSTAGVCRSHYRKRRLAARTLPCSADGCDRLAAFKGMCDYHYRAHLAAAKSERCAHEACDRPVYAKRLCALHYDRLKWAGRRARSQVVNGVRSPVIDPVV